MIPWRSLSFLAAVLAAAAAAAIRSGYYGAASEPLGLALMGVAVIGLFLGIPDGPSARTAACRDRHAPAWPLESPLESAGAARAGPVASALVAAGGAALCMAPATRLAGALLLAGGAAMGASWWRLRLGTPRAGVAPDATPLAREQRGVEGEVAGPAAVERFALALALAGAAAAIGAAAYPIYERLELLRPGGGLLARLVSLPALASGAEVRVAGTDLLVAHSFGAQTLAIDWWRAGGPLLADLVVVHAALTVALGGARGLWRSTLPFAGLLAAYAVLRALLVAVVSVHTAPDLRLSLTPDAILASFAPFLLFCWPFAARLAPAASFAPARARIAIPALPALLGTALLVLALHGHDEGIPRPGRVLLDEAHSDWEKSDVPFDRETFGKYTTYNYSVLADVLARSGELTVRREGPLDAAALAGVQVLILKTPTRPYAAEECRAVLDHVEAGGGLWLIGDHTNLMGMGEILNRIAVPLGMRFRYDSTFATFTGQPTLNETVGPLHPVAMGTEGLGFQTTCTIEPLTVHAVPAMIGRAMTSEHADFGHPHFFGNIRTDVFDEAGCWAQLLTASHGRGRVVAFSDSTILSNFAIAEPGVLEMVGNSVRWLMSAERLPRWWRAAAAGAGLVLLALALAAARGALRFRLPAIVSACALVALPGAALLEAHARRQVERPPAEPPAAAASPEAAPAAARDPHRVIAFVKSASSFSNASFLDESSETGPSPQSARSIATFYTWAMRVGGALPRTEEDLAGAIARRASVIVAYEPARAPDAAELEQVFQYVAGGGVFLLMTGVHSAAGGTAAEWLKPFRMEIEPQSAAVKVHRVRPRVRPRVHLALSRQIPALSATESVLDILALEQVEPDEAVGETEDVVRLGLKGGVPVFVDGAGTVVASRQSIGRGSVLVYTLSHGLSNRVMGTRYDPPPDEKRRSRYDVAFAVLDEALRLAGAAGGDR